jgi:hypothetical protein
MGAGGDYHEMEKASEILQKANHSLANAYVAKTGKSKEEVLALMENETWLTAEEAVENGFADSIMFENEERPQLVADGGSGLIPQKLINEVKKLKNQQSPTVQMNLSDEQVQRIVNEVTSNLKKDAVIETDFEEPSNESPFAKFLF